MRNLETYVNEKLRVTKDIYVPDLIALLKSKDIKEFNSRCEQLSEYLKNDSDLPIAELEYLKGGPKKLSKKYENTHDTFLWVNNRLMQYGTWDELYSLYWSRANNSIRNYNSGVKGFKTLLCYDDERSYSKGVFIITENTELMKQIDYLMRKAEMFRLIRKLETYVNEKLRVSKENTISLDTDIYKISSRDEFNTYLRKANEWLQSFATPVPKNKSNKNILNNDDLYISIDTKFNTYALSIGYKNKETVLTMFVHSEEVMKTNAKGNDTGWRVYDTVFIVPNELKDDVIEIINYKVKK